MIFKRLYEEDIPTMVGVQTLASFNEGWTVAQHQSAFKTNNYYVVGCFCDGQLVGFISGTISDDFSDINDVVVIPSYRRQGIAYYLIAHLFEAFALSQKHSVCFLEVEESNIPAINLYKKAGFIEISRRKDYYGKDRHAIVMNRELWLCNL